MRSRSSRPAKRERRKELPQPAERDSLPGEAEPSALTAPRSVRSAGSRRAYDEGGGHFLLYGATGSGKTEVYLQAAGEALARGLGVIVLVPEIALAPQTVGRFRARFGDRVAILHSSLTEAERRDERERIASGDAPIVIGARSAIFAPLPRLGLICVDEEHDAAYKQESDPRYDARTVAAKRASLEGAVAIYGSATPRPESWEALERLELGERIGVAPPVRARRRPARRGRLSAVGAAARGARQDRRAAAARRSCCSTAAGSLPRCIAGPAARRGAARAATSRSCCTETRRCTATTAATRSRRPRPVRPAARSSSRGSARARSGSSASSKRTFPSSSASGSMPTRSRSAASWRTTLRRFAAADRAVLVGTQMVAKGHHFADVSLAAVIDADSGLGMPDFRAEERTFQLVTQLAGRSGRDAPGKVLVQTFQPESRAVALAVRQDVEGVPRR